MADRSDAPSPPEGLPDSLASELSRLTPEELRNTIVHAQELLQSHQETASPIEPRPGEDIIRVIEHDGYTEVVKRLSCAEGCENCPHGPFLYHVSEETRPEGGTRLHWTFLGAVSADDG